MEILYHSRLAVRPLLHSRCCSCLHHDLDGDDMEKEIKKLIEDKLREIIGLEHVDPEEIHKAISSLYNQIRRS